MNRKSYLGVMAMEGMEMVPKFLQASLTYLLQPCHHFLPTPPCSYLLRGISVGKKVFISGCDFGLPHVYGKTRL